MSDVRGLGIDLCDIQRMDALLQNKAFVNRVFTQAEQQYLQERAEMGTASAAAMWAAKEAALKAFGVGMALPLTEIEIAHEPSGRPYYVLHGQALATANGGQLLLSLTHEGNTAAAVCVWSI